MATETVPSDRSTTPEQVKKDVQEEVKTIEQHTSLSKSGEEDQPKAESPTPAPSVEPGKKIEDKKVEPPVIEEVKETEEGEKPKAEDLPSPEVPSAKLEEKIEDREIGTPSIEEAKKTDEEQEPKAEDLPRQSAKETEDIKTEAVVVDEVNKTEPAGPDVTSQLVEQLVIETVEEQPKVESAIESTLEKAEEEPKVVQVPESSAEAIVEKEEQVEKLTVKESKAEAAQDEAEEILEALPVVEDKQQEQSEVTEPVDKESASVESKESVDIIVGVDEKTSADKVEDANASEVDELAKEVPLASGSSDQVTSTEQATLDKKEESHPTDIAEEPTVKALDVKEKEFNGSNASERVSKEEAVVEAENEIKDVKGEEEREEKAVLEEYDQPATKIGETVNSSTSAPEVTGKTLEEEVTSRDIDFIAENGKETIKDDRAAVETTKDGKVERKENAVTITATNEAKEYEVSVGGEETSQTSEDKLEKEKEADVPNPESKEGDATKTSQDPPKEEVQAKSTQKQSNNILSKVKQSLVKAKKAIIGKSPNSKASSVTKAEDKTKQ